MRDYADNINDSAPKLKRFFDRRRGDVVILSHVDADGLSSAALLKAYLRRSGVTVHHVYPGKGENAYTPHTVERLRALKPKALFVLDLGVMDQELVPGAPTVFIDHHRPFGHPPGAIVASSYGSTPSPPTTYVTWEVLSRVSSLAPRHARPGHGAPPDISDLSWLCAVGTAGDMGTDFVLAGADGERAGAPKLKKRDVADAEVLINSAKRASAYDIETAIGLLDEAKGLADLVDQDSPLVARLQDYRREVNEEVKRCRHEKPSFLWRVAVIPFKSPCDIQGLIVETWRRQLGKYFVIAANFGYIEGKVAYVIRTERDSSVIDLMESIKPPDFPGHVVFGHDRAGGGIVPTQVWAALAERMGFRETRRA